jgi:hypothetical protein
VLSGSARAIIAAANVAAVRSAAASRSLAALEERQHRLDVAVVEEPEAR